MEQAFAIFLSSLVTIGSSALLELSELFICSQPHCAAKLHHLRPGDNAPYTHPSKHVTLSSHQAIKAKLSLSEPPRRLIKQPPPLTQLADNSSESIEMMKTAITAVGRGPYPIPSRKMSALPTVSP